MVRSTVCRLLLVAGLGLGAAGAVPAHASQSAEKPIGHVWHTALDAARGLVKTAAGAADFASRATDPPYLGQATGKVYSISGSCWFTVDYRGPMPVNGHLHPYLHVKGGTGLPYVWNCYHASWTKVSLQAAAPDGGVYTWVCWGHLAHGAPSSWEGFTGLTARCHSVSGLGGEFHWQLNLLVKFPSELDGSCNQYYDCSSIPYTGVAGRFVYGPQVTPVQSPA